MNNIHNGNLFFKNRKIRMLKTKPKQKKKKSQAPSFIKRRYSYIEPRFQVKRINCIVKPNE